MNCQFCNNPCHRELTHGSEDLPGTSDFTCDYCNVVYEYFHAPQLLHQYTMYWHEWIAEFHLYDNSFTLWKTKPIKPSEPEQNGWTHVLDLDFLPDITPTNFEQKINLYLVFL